MNTNFATKYDLKELGFIMKADLKDEISGLRVEMKDEIGSLRSEMKDEFASLRSEMKDEIGGLRLGFSEIKSDIQEQNHKLTIKLGGVMVVGIGVLSVISKL